jgi:hypothetical protein
MSADLLKNIDELIKLALDKKYNGCSVLYGILHRKKEKDYLNLFSIAIFDSKENNDGIIEELHNISGDNYSILLFRQNILIDNIEKILKSLNNDKLKIFSTNYGEKDLNIFSCSIKYTSFLDTEAIDEYYEGLIPKIKDNIYLFELFCLNKEALKEVNGEKVKIDIFCEYLLQNYKINLSTFYDRIGNFLFLLPENNIVSSFFGNYTNQDLLFIENKTDNTDYLKDVLITLKSESNYEIVDSLLIDEVKEKEIIEKFNKDGKITLEVWNKKNKSLVFKNSGFLIKDIIIRTNLIIGKRIINNSKTGEKTEINLISKDNDHQNTNLDIRDFINARIDKNNKDNLIKSKSIFFYKVNEREKALKDVIDLINKESEDYLLIWDPYFSENDLQEILPRIEKPDLDIKIICDFVELKHDYRDDETVFINRFKKVIDELHKARIKIELRYRFENIGFPFHDRFLITKNKCWMLGPSFNSLGKSHSVMIKLPYPEIIIDEFFKLWEVLISKKIV